MHEEVSDFVGDEVRGEVEIGQRCVGRGDERIEREGTKVGYACLGQVQRVERCVVKQGTGHYNSTFIPKRVDTEVEMLEAVSLLSL